jgi:hypothetical protein
VNLPFDVRPVKDNDVPFIYATWLRSQRRQGDNTLLTSRIYFDGAHRRIARTLIRPTVQAFIICNPEDEEQLYGYVVTETIGPVFAVHFAYVKRAFRRLGLMKSVLPFIYSRFGKEEIAITHISDFVKDSREKYRLKFNPYLEEILK